MCVIHLKLECLNKNNINFKLTGYTTLAAWFRVVNNRNVGIKSYEQHVTDNQKLRKEKIVIVKGNAFLQTATTGMLLLVLKVNNSLHHNCYFSKQHVFYVYVLCS